MKPNICLVRIDETSHCNEAWLEKWAINKLWAYYLYDANLHVHLCSLYPSYELHFYGYVADHNLAEDDEQSRDGLDMELSTLLSEPVDYHSARAIDALPEEDRAILGVFEDSEELQVPAIVVNILTDAQKETNDRIRKEAIDAACEQISQFCPETTLQYPDIDYFTREDPPPTEES